MIRSLTIPLLVAALLGVSACGGDDDSDSQAERPAATSGGETSQAEPQKGNGAPARPEQDEADRQETDGPPPPREQGSEADDPGDAEDLPQPSGTVDTAVATSIELGTSMEDAVEELGAEPTSRRAGPGGTTCLEFRVRPTKKNAPPVDRRLRAVLCFKGGKLRGSTVANRPLEQ
jgi:hypothetical protein